MVYLTCDWVKLLAVIEVNDDVNHHLAGLFIQAGEYFPHVSGVLCFIHLVEIFAGLVLYFAIIVILNYNLFNLGKLAWGGFLKHPIWFPCELNDSECSYLPVKDQIGCFSTKFNKLSLWLFQAPIGVPQ